MRVCKLVVILLVMLGTSRAVEARTYEASLPDVAGLLEQARAGDCIVIRPGCYQNVALKWQATGSEQQPITIKAQQPGTVIVTGRSSLQLAGQYLTIQGLYFKDGSPTRRAVIDFSIGNRYAYHCRLTDCVVDNFNSARRDVISSYIVLSGRYNRIDHCSLTGKCTLGVTLLVNLNGEECLRNHHQIDHNYFGHRDVYGSNGAETMRIGTSQQSYLSSNTVVEDNLFEQCNGEVEVISVKSSDNIIRRNTLLECEGVVALRHGRRNLVEQNYFIGNNRRNTGGVRIVDANHRVVGNVFYQLAGTRFFSALGVMNAVPNSLPNRYVLVKDVTISGNTFFDCKSIEMGTGKDPERTEAPQNVTFTDNIVGNSDKERPQLPDDKKLRHERGASWAANVQQSTPIADTLIVLSDREYAIDKPIVISRPTTLSGNGTTVLRYIGEQSAEGMIIIAQGGSLTVSGIVFDGVLEPGKRLAAAGITTAENMNRTYRLKVDHCTFRNFNESGFSAIRGGKATFADSVVIRHCDFYDISGNGIDYAAERDDKGRYNADDIVIEDCRFNRFLGIPVNIYRGGSDESTAGPYVKIARCTFSDCCNRQRGSVMRLIGPQLMDIGYCQFNGSGRGGASIRLDEAIWEDITIHHCTFVNSGRMMMSTDRVVTHDNIIR